MSAPRFRVEPGDVPAAIAARRLGLSEAEFNAKLPRLLSRGFPAPDPDTDKFDLDAINAWRKLRYPRLFSTPTLTLDQTDEEARAEIDARLGIGGTRRASG